MSIIVAARNYGRYLRDAISSALSQRVMPCEVIYSDDGSGDRSAEQVEREFPQVKVLRQDWRGVCAARNRAADIARGDWLLFLDGDDMLPPNYLEARLANASQHPEAAIIYGNAQCFGTRDKLYQAVEWEPGRLWVRNWINSTSLVRRAAFEHAGGWKTCLNTGWDWDLWLRMTQLGYAGACDPDGVLLYRHHDQSNSHKNGLKSEAPDTLLPFFWFFRTINARLRIVSIVSGRLLELFPRWISRIQENVAEFTAQYLVESAPYAFRDAVLPRPAVHLGLYCTGPAGMMPTIYREIERVGEVFDEVEILHAPWQSVHHSEQDRRENVCRFLASAYNRLLRDEVWWTVEDDVIPPTNALASLHAALLRQAVPRYAVAGWYFNRHRPHQLSIHQWRDGRATAETKPPWVPAYYDLAGTGCLMAFRPLASHAFTPHAGAVPAHDWAWCLRLREYRQAWHPREKAVMVLPEVACRHHVSADEAV